MPGRDVDLWYTYLSQTEDGGLLERYRELMSPDEREREQRFLLPRVRHQFRVTRALVRCVLSRYADVDPRQWVFTPGTHGKPSVASPEDRRIAFNISHTHGLVTCAVTAADCVGVDVEDMQRRTAGIELAKRFFAAPEVDWLARAAPREQTPTFFQFWTLKESYIKAVGEGLSIPLDSFWFALTPHQQPSIAFAADRDDDPDRWQFAQIRLAGRHQLAVCAALPPSESLTVRCQAIVPLCEPASEPFVCDGGGGWSVVRP